MSRMKSIASVLSVIALGFGLLSCTNSGGGGGGSSTSTFAVSTTAADFGVVGNSYSTTLVTVNGTAPLTWSLSTGSLPAGLNPVIPATGTITGTPTVQGSFTATFTVTDSTGKTATGSVLFAVHPRTDVLSVDNGAPPVPGIGGPSSRPSISDDGRFAVFASSASNLVPGISGSQIYLHDWQTNQTTLISRDGIAVSPTGGNGTSSAPSISGDGQFMAFVSDATNLLPAGSPAVTSRQIYVHDRQLGVTSLVSRDNSSNQASAGVVALSPSISGDGRFVAFVSSSANLVSSVSVFPQVYLRDVQLGVTSLVSQDNSSNQASAGVAALSPSISGDGRFVAFVSSSANLVPSVSVFPQIYLRDVQLGVVSLVSKDNSPVPVEGNGLSSEPSVNANGRFVAFSSLSINLGAVSGNQQIYVRALP